MDRIGFSKDIHRLVKGRKLILAGVVIPSPVGELAHSDGDVVFHAVSEAILGGLALGDLGKYFPPLDSSIEGIDSAIIVQKIVGLMKEKHYCLGNIDIHILLETPKLAAHIEKMRNNIAQLLETNIENVSITAGTNEGLGEVGKKEAVEASAIVLLRKA